MRFMFLGVQLLDGFETTRDNVRGDLPELVRAAGFQDVSETYRQRTPVLRVRLGEEVVVRLQNDLPQPTTIHWHGVRVPKAMDGVPGVTQDPIPPGGSFTYRFVPKDAGTFWFHPHVRGAEQVERGLYGVLIVDDAETLPYSRDEVWVLDDWRLGSDGQVDPRFVTRHDLAHDGRWGQMVTVNGDAARQLTVRPGERVRLRLVNTSNGRVYRPDFGSLEPRVIAVDGMYTARPLPLDGFELGAAAKGAQIGARLAPRIARSRFAMEAVYRARRLQPNGVRSAGGSASALRAPVKSWYTCVPLRRRGMFQSTRDLRTWAASIEVRSRRHLARMRHHINRCRGWSGERFSGVSMRVDARTASRQDYARLDWDRRFGNRRKRGVARFWAAERRTLRSGGAGTRNWTPEQVRAILDGRILMYGGVAMEGHHRYNALDYPHLADDPSIIYPATVAERW